MDFTENDSAILTHNETHPSRLRLLQDARFLCQNIT